MSNKESVVLSETIDTECLLSDNPNENCLAGFQCPKCKSFGPFEIYVTRSGFVDVFDDGTGDLHGDTEWDGASECLCPMCRHTAVVAEFRGETKAPALFYWAVTGRIPGDHEDALHVFHLESRVDAINAFEAELWEQECSDPAAREAAQDVAYREHGQCTFINSIVKSSAPIEDCRHVATQGVAK